MATVYLALEDLAVLAESGLDAAPGLQRILKNARHRGTAIDDLNADLAARLGLTWPAHATRGGGQAALAGLWDGLEVADHHWLRADPVSLHIDLNQIYLRHHGDLQLTKEDAVVLAEAVSPLFEDQPAPLATPHPERWYLRLDQPSAYPHTPPGVARGRVMDVALPEHPEVSRWRALLNASQMALHRHPVNVRREQQGLPAVNSLWFWGAGALPVADGTSSLQQVCSTDPVMLGMTRLAGVGTRDAAGVTPTTGLLSDCLSSGEPILIHWRPDFASDREQNLKHLEQDWVQPLQQRLENAEISTLCLLITGQPAAVYRPGRWHRLWHRLGSRQRP